MFPAARAVYIGCLTDKTCRGSHGEQQSDCRQYFTPLPLVERLHQVADMFERSLGDTVRAESGPPEDLPFPDADIATDRLQKKLDTFEPAYCSK